LKSDSAKMLFTWNFSLFIIMPTLLAVTAFLPPKKENADNEGDDFPTVHASSPRPDVPSGAPPLSPEAATPHAPRVLKGEALTLAPSTAPMIAGEHRRCAAESGDTRRTALPNGDQRS
jgi:hypothetical protein